MIRLIILFVFLVSCQSENKVFQLKGSTMGTYYSIKFSGVDSSNLPGLKMKIKQALERVNNTFSTYIADSEISKINRAEAGVPISLSEEMGELIELSKEVHSQTDGYFDITVGPIVNAWGFGPDGKRKRPTEAELSELTRMTGMDKLGMPNARTLVKKSSGVYLDMSAIAKGQGVDEVFKAS